MKTTALLVLALLLLTGCATVSAAHNFTSLRVGMTRDQVTEAMGEPDMIQAASNVEGLIYIAAYYGESHTQYLCVRLQDSVVVGLDSPGGCAWPQPVQAASACASVQGADGVTRTICR